MYEGYTENASAYIKNITDRLEEKDPLEPVEFQPCSIVLASGTTLLGMTHVTEDDEIIIMNAIQVDHVLDEEGINMNFWNLFNAQSSDVYQRINTQQVVTVALMSQPAFKFYCDVREQIENRGKEAKVTPEEPSPEKETRNDNIIPFP